MRLNTGSFSPKQSLYNVLVIKDMDVNEHERISSKR